MRAPVAAVLLLLLLAEASAAPKADIPGFSFIQLTDNDRHDAEPRVSANGYIVWTGTGSLIPNDPDDPSALDREVLLWDGSEIRQVTKDSLRQTRAVVNNKGDLAYQVMYTNINGPLTEIEARIEGKILSLTADPAPGVEDRYPDINDRGVVVWGRQTAPAIWHYSLYDPLVGLPFALVDSQLAYRPHINNADHVEMGQGQGTGVHDLAGRLIFPIPLPGSLGYGQYRRLELNEHDHLAIEADPSTPLSPDQSGPRDILLWDGTQMNVIFSSTVWIGRPDLNANGVIAWGGFGGLPGSTSTPEDREIFVYDPETEIVTQLTDDAVYDAWPTVMADGTVVWNGAGNYAGASFNDTDWEVFIARPDGAHFDLCGDVDDSRSLSLDDADLIRGALAYASIPSSIERCNVEGPVDAGDQDGNGVRDDCSLLDWVILARELRARLPGLPAACHQVPLPGA